MYGAAHFWGRINFARKELRQTPVGWFSASGTKRTNQSEKKRRRFLEVEQVEEEGTTEFVQ